MDTKATVLVVEDDEAIQQLVMTFLRLDGYAVICANDGLAALQAVAQVQPDLILLDMGLPNMDGAAFITAYCQTPSPHAPIIGMSAYQINSQLCANLAGFLNKPFDTVQLRATLESVRLGYAKV